jgi:cystathionine gamma-synthase
VVLANDVYGGTFRQFNRVHRPWGLDFDPVDLSDPDVLAAAWRPRTRMLWIETPTNPLMSIFDVAALAAFAHERDARVVVDNTFATPYLQQPLALGADVVVHSTTKYLGGHSDVVGGAVLLDDDELAGRIGFLQNAVGAVPGPWDAWLVLRGIKTLAVRMRAHCENARAVVAALVRHAAVERVLYPGLPDHPGHEIAARQMRDFGGMVAFRMADEPAALRACARFRVFTLAESLGGVESLVEHPGRMTHQSVAGSLLEVPGDLVRLSVGIEDADDLVEDVEQALGP